jgi:hypothetical protein
MKKPASKSGKQQRPSFSDPKPTKFWLLKRRMKTPDVTGLMVDDFSWGDEINGQVVPELDKQWLELAQKECPASMSEEYKRRLKDILETYLRKRFALATSVSYRDLTSALERIDKAAKALLDAIQIYDHSHVLAWRKLESMLPVTGQLLKRDDVYPVISFLVSQTNIAAGQVKAQSETSQSTFRPIKVWEDFARGITQIFQENGWDVKISKSQGKSEGVSTPHPSPFVNFAWSLTCSLPPELREHCSSIWTLADALQKAKISDRKNLTKR